MTVSLVIDTSYLLELYRVPAHSSESASAEIKKRFGQHVATKSRFFVPLGCILELGNHIAQLDDGGRPAPARSEARRRRRIFCQRRQALGRPARGRSRGAAAPRR